MNFRDFSRFYPIDLSVPYFDTFFRLSNGFPFGGPQRSIICSAKHTLDEDPLSITNDPLSLQLNVWKADNVTAHVLGASLAPSQALWIGWRIQYDVIRHEFG